MINSQTKELITKVEKKWKSSRLAPAKILKQALDSFSLQQKKEFFSNCLTYSIAELIYQRANFIDQAIALLWQKYSVNTQATIVAVGGYGRGELFPHSDIDVLILLSDTTETDASEIKKIMHILWDSGLNLKSNVCKVGHCKEMMKEDITIMTSMIESRFISGNWEIYQSFTDIVNSEMSTCISFVEKKKQEMIARHHKYNDTSYLLEPNLKESPSNLRDIHTVMWIARAILGITQFEQFVEKGYLTQKEYDCFMKAMYHLWRFRFALHMLTQRDENRLLFDLQIRIAQKFGYKKSPNKHAVELCMQKYYKQLIIIRRTCFLLLQEMEESSNSFPDDREIVNKRFQINRGVIEMRNPYVFKHYPFALLEVFLLIQSREDITGLGAETSRKIIEDASLIDKDYWKDIRHKSLFLEIIKRRDGVYETLTNMHEHGILRAYIQYFSHVEGLMQFDLFHIYTVDAHTLIVVRNLLRFFYLNEEGKFKREYKITQTLPKPELLILAGLFHDIGKGGKEEHQHSGARIALSFCRDHYFSEEDSQLVSWLVACHLELSVTAQKMNIYDPNVLSIFLKKNQPKHKSDLDYLYLLTIADILATGPNLLNDYKYTLIGQLWQLLKRAMDKDFEDTPQQVGEIKKMVMQALRKEGFPVKKVKQFFNHWNHQYFIEQSIDDMLKQATLVLRSDDPHLAIGMNYNATFQATELLIWSHRGQYQFARITACLDHHNYSIIRAQVRRDAELYVLYAFIIEKFNATAYQETDEQLIAILKHELADLAENKHVTRIAKKSKRRLQDRRVKTLLIETQVYFEEEKYSHQTALNLITRDRPGILALIGEILGDFKVLVAGAYVTTFGGKVEDKFYLLDSHQQELSPSLMEKIRKKITRVLS